MILFRTVWIRRVLAHLVFSLVSATWSSTAVWPPHSRPQHGLPVPRRHHVSQPHLRQRHPGLPPASYTWTRTAGGWPGSGGTLTFDTVTSDLHNRTVSCRASNDFTVDKDRPLVEASRRLQVYCEYRDRACDRWLLKNCIESVVHTAHLLTEAFVPFIRTLSAA